MSDAGGSRGLIDLASLRGRVPAELRTMALVTCGVGAMHGVADSIRGAAGCAYSVLLYGETGSGKEIAARTIHELSGRSRKPYCAVSCGALPAGVIESELYGHVRGAFSGAHRDNAGLFRAAHGGTLFLDEVNAMADDLQTKLSRTLQERTVRPLGSQKEIPVDVRVIASCRGLLQEALRDKGLREDLFYRLRGIVIHLPPLRKRPDDIPILFATFAERRSQGLRSITEGALALLMDHAWPGNVRELQTLVDRILDHHPGIEVVREEHVAAHIVDPPADPEGDAPPVVHSRACPTLREAERSTILRALEAAAGNKTRAASLLGVSRRTLGRLLGRHGIR